MKNNMVEREAEVPMIWLRPITGDPKVMLGIIEALRLAYKTGHSEGYIDATDDGTGNGYSDHNAAEEGWQQYKAQLDESVLAAAKKCDGDNGVLADRCNHISSVQNSGGAVSIEGVPTQPVGEPEGWREALEAENADLRALVIAFGAPWVVTYARERGLPEGHLYPTHYDILARCGARMDNFTRAALASPPTNDEGRT
jgi:hypothetical protein